MSESLKIRELKDEELLVHYKEGYNNIYIEALFGRHIRFVFLVCMKYLKDEHLAKDITMTIFEKSIEDIKRFEIQDFKSWIYKVTRNACFMHLRKGNKTILFPDDKKSFQKIVENDNALHHTSGDTESQLQQLETAMKTLDEAQRKCVDLFYLQEKSYKEVVELTGFSMNEVKSHIQNGKRNLKNVLQKSMNIGLILFLYNILQKL